MKYPAPAEETSAVIEHTENESQHLDGWCRTRLTQQLAIFADEYVLP